MKDVLTRGQKPARLGKPGLRRLQRAVAVVVSEQLEPRCLLTAAPNFPNGFNTSNTTGVMTLNGTTTLNGTSLQLTDGGGGEAGSAFSDALVSDAGFTTTFAFTQTSTSTPADGMTFTMQNVKPTAIGEDGGGLGYSNDNGNGGITSSIAVKFDLYNNVSEGNDSTGLFVDGDSPTIPSGSNSSEASVDMSASGVKLTSGDPMSATLSYNGTTLSETVTDTTLKKTFSTSYTINIPTTIGSPTAYIGFTGGTGGLASTQRISTWTYAAVTSPPYAPTSLLATPASSTELDLSWADPNSTVSSYTVYQQISGSYTQIGTTTGTTFPVTGLTPNTTYSFEIKATNSGGSATSAAFSGTTPLRPSQISNLVSSGVTTSTATLNWQVTGSGVTSITVTRTLIPDDTVVTTTLAANAISYSDSSLSPGREYNYAVSASTSAGATQPATIAVQTTPGQVQNLDGTVNGTTVSLEWDALGYAVSGYNIYRGTSPGGESATPIATNVIGTVYNDVGLTTGVTYYYTVTAVDTGGESVQSGEISALAAVATPDLVISEFMASNSTSITDAAGEHSDWIEIHNAGSGDADLSQYYLTDDATEPELWQFPEQTLAAGGYLIVFADGENVAVAGQELHTNFSLSTSGEYLALIGQNDIPQFAFSPTYPVQYTDISYGLSDSDNPSSALVYFGTPTPGAANAPTASEATFSQAGETFAGSISITLASPTPGAQIRYTLDNSTPTSSSTLYTGAITVSKTEMVRARVFATGYTASVVDSQSYIALASTVSGFSNNLGIVVIDTFGQALNDTTDVLAAATFIPATNGNANAIGSASNYDGRIGLHIRGNSSETFPKQQWSIDLWDENDDTTKASLMGMPSDSKWILNDPWSEKSLLQNPLSYEWANETGEYASRTQFVEVFLNTTGSSTISYASNYWGVYILEERVKIASGRVDITSMPTTATTAPADTGGYLWELDRPDPGDATFTTSTEDLTYINIEPNAGDINSTQESYITNYVDNFETALYGSNFENPTTGYAAYIDVGSFVNTWLMEEMIKNIDGFRLSSYYYKDENGKIVSGPIWDNNLALGNSNYSVNGDSNPADLGSDPEGWDDSQLTNSEYPYYNRLFQDPTFKQDVVDRWSQLRATVFSNSNLVANINTLVNELSDNTTNYPVGANGAIPTQSPTNAVVRNFVRWPVLGVYEWPNGFYDPQGRWIEEVDMVKNWVLARVSWMDRQLLPAPVITPPGGVQNSLTSVTITPYTNVAADTVLLAAGATAQAKVPTAAITNWYAASYNASSWSTGTTGVGYEKGSAFTSYIGLNTSSMYNTNSTVYIRTSFTVVDPTTVQDLILQMRYSGGFVAYLNGTEIAYANVSNSNDYATSSWNSSSSGSQSASAAVAYQEFDVSVFKDALVAGTNVLAIQGLNSSTTNSDFLIEPQLISRVTTPVGSVPVYYTTNGTDPRNSDGSISSSALLYSGALSLSSNTQIEARTYINGTWSGLASGIYQFARPTIAITELNYDPAKPPTGSSYNNDDFEFIEFENYGTSPVNLNGIAFTAGIKYTFGNVTLNPGQVGVLVHNTAAFQSRYGTSINIIGDYLSTGESFSNSGELVTLVDALGNTLSSFTYSPTWYASTHGNGASLEVIYPTSLPNLNLASSWIASTVTNGTPGTIELNLTGPAYLKMDSADQYLDVWNTASTAAAFVQEIPLASLNAITYTGTAAGTGLTVDFSNGDPLIASGLAFNGGTGNLSYLTVVGTTGADTLTVNATTLAYNSSIGGSAVITYSNASAISFNGGTGNDVLTQAAQPASTTTLTFVSPTSADTLNVTVGTFTIAAPAAGAGIVTTTLGTLSISAGAAVTVASAAAHTDRNLLQIANLNIAGSNGSWTGRLDIGSGDLDISNSSIATVSNQIAQGLLGSTGIVSSAVSSNASHLTALAAITNQGASGFPLYGSGTPLGLFDGANPAATDVLVKYTYVGDANLDGAVDGSDYTLIDNGFNNHLTGWIDGDFNGDGKIDGSDYTLIDNAFNTQGASLASQIAATAKPQRATAVFSSQMVTPASLFSDEDDKRRRAIDDVGLD